MQYLTLIFGIAIFIFAFSLVYEFKVKNTKNLVPQPFQSQKPKQEKKTKVPSSFAKCPLCSSQLKVGERLVSRIYGSLCQKEGEKRCHVMGCPHCYPKKENDGAKRICPVCKKDVPEQNGYLVARLFCKTKDGKKHLIITGCNRCSSGKKHTKSES